MVDSDLLLENKKFKNKSQQPLNCIMNNPNLIVSNLKRLNLPEEKHDYGIAPQF